MFKKRPNNQNIEYIHFGAPQKMPSGEILRNGDSVILKHNQYEINIVNITVITETSFSGTVNSIITTDNEEKADEQGVPLDMQYGDIVKFSKDNIFSCERKS